MAFEQDVAAFLNAAEFAVVATYDGSTPVTGIPNLDSADFNGVASLQTSFLCRASDVPAEGVGKTLAWSAVTYRIRHREPHNDGLFALLHLEKQ